MLPFLKRNQEASASGEDEPTKRKHDESFDMLDAIAGDMLAAFKKGDKGHLKAALEAFCAHIQDQDEIQDQSMGDGGL